MIESNFQIINAPELVRFEFVKNIEFAFNGELELDINAHVEVFVNGDTECTEGRVDLHVDIFNRIPFENVPFTLKTTITGYFNWDQTLSANKEQLETLLNVNGASLLYSYLRPVISNMTLSANLPPLVLPLMNFTRD